MDILNASVVTLEDCRFIAIQTESGDIRIPMSEDKPNDVKGAFNKLIARLKGGKFQIKLQGVGEDLFAQVANEYITQLNREIQEVFGQMEEYGLVKK